MIALTATACLLAILFRTPVRSRYWAWRIERSQTPDQQVVYVNLLLNAGAAAHWGTTVLLEHADVALREYGVLILGTDPGDWSRQRLLSALADPVESVRNLATMSLARHRDESVVPQLETIYRSGNDDAAASACLALARIAKPSAFDALARFASEPAGACRRADLVDALAIIRTTKCVPLLLSMLADHRRCAAAPRLERRQMELLRKLQAGGAVDATREWATPGTDQSVAERAADVLVRITGLDPAFSSELPESERQRAEAQWANWLADKAGVP